MNKLSTNDYIAEIDGLRAIAVLSVLFYHARISKMDGGYIGVDIFFVISGYLITKILVNKKEFNGYELKMFYFQRILRIVPALFSVVTLTILVFFIISPPIRSNNFTHSAISAIFSYSNFWFYKTIDYFSDNSRNPFLHTWSLAIEEQFYLCLPILIWGFSGKLRIYRPWIFYLLFTISIVASIFIAKTDQVKAFYFPWLRAWELLAGSLLSIVPLIKLAHSIKLIISNTGLLIIFISLFIYSDKTLFPGAAAIPPVIGSMGVIAGAGSHSITNWVLRTRIMRWTGNISYSLYLVHWPIVCVAGLWTNVLLNTTKISIILSSFFLAWISWRFIETPARQLVNIRTPRQVFTGFLVTCFCLVPYTFAIQAAGKALWNRSPLALEYTTFMKADLTLFRNGSCFLTPRYPDLKYFQEDCIQKLGNRPGVLVIGDSHAANIVAGLAEQHLTMSFLQATAVGCKPVLDTVGPTYCTALMQRILREWLLHSGDTVQYVVIAARWVDGDLEPLKRTVSYLKKLGKQVIVYGPSPEYSMSVPMILAYSEILGLDLSPRLAVVDRFRLDKKMESTFSNSETYFSPIEQLCEQGRCQIIENGIPMMSDGDHFTQAGVTKIIKNFPIPKIE